MLNQNLLLAGDDGYNLTNSLRFRGSATAYLNRTLTTPTNNKIFTWSSWIKLGTAPTAFPKLFAAASSRTTNFYDNIGFDNNNLTIEWNGASSGYLVTSQVFRDPSAWYHVVVAVDTTQATASNRCKVYVNGTQVTSFSTATYPALNYTQFFNSAVEHRYGAGQAGSGLLYFYDGLITETNFIDGQALTPTSFGSFNAITGVWQPAKYTGTYGTNGFYLPFTNTTSTSTLGNDLSGNSNTWTTNNISLTSGSTYDSMTDVPTLTSTTVANFAVINPVNGVGPSVLSITGANLNFAQGSANYGLNVCSMAITSKIYFEITLGSSATGSGKNSYCGVGSRGSANEYSSSNYFGTDSFAWSLGYSNATAYINNNGTQNTQSGTIANGDVFMYAVDPPNGRIWFGRNGTWYAGSPSAGTGASYTNLPTEVFPVVQAYDSSTHSINFGQRPFSYTPPSGYTALNTFNL